MKVERPGSKTPMTPGEMAREIADRMIGLFTRDADGRRPIYGGTERFQQDPHWRDCCCSTSTSTATTAPASAPIIRPAGPAWSRT